MTTPRKISTDSMRVRLPTATSVAVDIGERQCSKKASEAIAAFGVCFRRCRGGHDSTSSKLAGAPLIGAVKDGASRAPGWDCQFFRRWITHHCAQEPATTEPPAVENLFVKIVDVQWPPNHVATRNRGSLVHWKALVVEARNVGIIQCHRN